MEFLIGFSFFLVLVVFTVLLWLIAKRLPKELVLAPVVFMIMGDGILVALWYFGLVELIEQEKIFRLGIAAAFCAASMGRSIYFLLQNEKV